MRFRRIATAFQRCALKLVAHDCGEPIEQVGEQLVTATVPVALLAFVCRPILHRNRQVSMVVVPCIENRLRALAAPYLAEHTPTVEREVDHVQRAHMLH
ncbi:hypothetical protein DM75_3990 [Burkholderia mallei]|nr:hypothetical protein DM75_3990 [Burkholderia mallei]